MNNIFLSGSTLVKFSNPESQLKHTIKLNINCYSILHQFSCYISIYCSSGMGRVTGTAQIL